MDGLGVCAMGRVLRLFATAVRFGSMRRGLALVLALVALLWQAGVVQTHVHLDGPGHETGIVAQAGLGISSTQGHADGKPIPCILCQDRFSGSQFVLGAPPVLHIPAFTLIETAALAIAALGPRVAAHFWIGRAPPTF